MSARDNNFYGLNSNRSYPLSDAATGIDDAGTRLPFGILVDARIRFPKGLGRVIYVNAVTVSPGVVTLVFLCGPDPVPLGATDTAGTSLTFTPIASISVPQPAPRFRALALTALVPGVGGWIVLGGSIDSSYSGRFSQPAQSALLTRCATPYTPPSLSSVQVPLGSNVLSGTISLKAGGDLSITTQTRTIAGASVKALVLSLADSIGRDVLSTYAGPCGGRPESGSCSLPGIEYVNGVTPDAAGNLTVTIIGGTSTGFVGGGGLGIAIPYTVADLCGNSSVLPNSVGQLPDTPTDLCAGIMAVGPPESFGAAAPSLDFDFQQSLTTEFSVVSGSFATGSGIVESLDPGLSLALLRNRTCGGRSYSATCRGGSGFVFGWNEVERTGDVVITTDASIEHWRFGPSNPIRLASAPAVESALRWVTLTASVSLAGEVLVDANTVTALPVFTVDPDATVGLAALHTGGEIARFQVQEVVSA
jgi:hypothetical protein